MLSGAYQTYFWCGSINKELEKGVSHTSSMCPGRIPAYILMNFWFLNESICAHLISVRFVFWCMWPWPDWQLASKCLGRTLAGGTAEWLKFLCWAVNYSENPNIQFTRLFASQVRNHARWLEGNLKIRDK